MPHSPITELSATYSQSTWQYCATKFGPLWTRTSLDCFLKQTHISISCFLSLLTQELKTLKLNQGHQSRFKPEEKFTCTGYLNLKVIKQLLMSVKVSSFFRSYHFQRSGNSARVSHIPLGQQREWTPLWKDCDGSRGQRQLCHPFCHSSSRHRPSWSGTDLKQNNIKRK